MEAEGRKVVLVVVVADGQAQECGGAGVQRVLLCRSVEWGGYSMMVTWQEKILHMGSSKTAGGTVV